MLLENFFIEAGKKLDPTILKKLAEIARQKPPSEEKKAEKSQQPEQQLEDQWDTTTLINLFINFANSIHRQSYYQAIIELLDILNLAPHLDTQADFHALLALSYVAVWKYDLAETEEKKARAMDSRWDFLDEIIDDAYDSMAELLSQRLGLPLEELDTDLDIYKDFHWDPQTLGDMIDELFIILEEEDFKVYKKMKAELPKLYLSVTGKIDDLIADLLEDILLPFLMRTYLQKAATAFKEGES
ncbi:MAG: hypothetical protein ONB05_02420 [candidate division KSB1 bacterium]|nr:hypothetical protein [candidate division KSB1 bacterium]